MAIATAAGADALRSFLAEEAGVEVGEETNPRPDENSPGEPKSYLRANGERYLARAVDANAAGATDDVELLRALRQAGIFTRLLSVPGTGKTASLEAAFGEELICVVCSEGLEEGELTGRYRQAPDGRWEGIHGALAVAMAEGRPIVLDEIGAAHPRVISRINGVFDGRLELVLHELADERICAAPGFWCALAYNPGPDFEISEAIASRFGFAIRYRTDLAAARRLGVPERAIQLAERLQHKADSGAGLWAPQMRELCSFQKIETLLGESWALGALLAACPEDALEDATAEAEAIFSCSVRPLEV